MNLLDIIIVLTIVAGGIFITGTIVHLISEELEYRRWWRKVKKQ